MEQTTIIGKAHKKQLEILNSIIDNNVKYHIINASRQSGKTTLSILLMMYYIINYTEKTILFVSPVHSQNKKIYDKLVDFLNQVKIIKKANGTDLDIYTVNKNVIYFKSADRPNNIRGYSVDLVILDEFAYIKNETWGVVRPTTAARKNSKVVVISTPKGTSNMFYELSILGQNEDNDNYMYYFMHYTMNPMYDLKEVLDAKEVLPENIFLTEYEGVFISDGLVFTNLDEVCSLSNETEPISNEQYFGGLDFGKIDSTVLTILDKNGNCVKFHRTNNKDWTTIENEIVEILEKYQPIVYVESNSGTINDPLFESLAKRYNNLYAFTTTNNSKEEIVQSMILSINENCIKLPNKDWNKQIKFEMGVFTYEYSVKTRKIKYSAPNGSNDDCVMSACLANKCYRENKNRIDPIYVEREYNNRW